MMKIPHRLFVEITTECNLRCLLCKLWQRHDPIDRLSLRQKIKFLENFFNMLEKSNPNYRDYFSVVLTGGEPFLYPEQVIEIAKKCKENRVNCYINTNGTLLEPFIDDILNCGLNALTISLDSHIKEIHDNLRGFNGLFKKIVDIITILVNKKRGNGYPIKICVQSILGKWNIRNLQEHISFFENLGLDGLMFQPIQYPFGLMIPNNWYENFDKFPRFDGEIENIISFILNLKLKNGFIMNSKEEVELWRYYFRNPELLPEGLNPCKSYKQNLIVDVRGNVKFCFNKYFEPPNMIGNILTAPMDELLFGKKAMMLKNEMQKCNRACGIMACHVDAKLRD